MRIEVSEAIEICSYGMSKAAQDTIKKHYKIYNDWGRVKDLLTESLIRQRAEYNALRNTLDSLMCRLERDKQIPLPYPRSKE